MTTSKEQYNKYMSSDIFNLNSINSNSQNQSQTKNRTLNNIETSKTLTNNSKVKKNPNFLKK